ncbi:MAG: hypothetical protein OEX07_03985, partial [Gammaproteobacteria bacterium]|nr:hypothetical protein [Gammaproteobacteria bacterium]
NSMDEEDSLESILSDSGFSFIFPAGKAASLIRVKANNKRIVAKRMIKLKLKPQPNLIANNSLQATGIILPAEIEKSEVASFEGKNSASVLRSIPDVIPAPIPASIVKNTDPKDFAMLSVTDDKQTAEKPVIELTVASPGKIAKKRILPMVRPFEEKNATANELAVSNLIWNDVKAYNAFDDSSPILLPGIDLISTWVGANDSTSISDSNSGSMYEEAEIAARKGNAGVAIWGNSMEYAGKIYIESHLSLVDEPVNFNVKFNSLNALSLSLTIPRTRFAFALKELSDKDINQRKLITLQDASVFSQQKASSKVKSTVNAGKIVKSNNTKNEWFKVSNVNGQHGWIHASKVAILPDEVYVQTPDISVFSEAGGGESTTVINPVDSLKVLDVKIINSITWFQVKLPSHLILSDSSTSGSLVTGWLNSVNLKSRPVLPMTEFLLGMQYFQRQDFDNAIQAINRFIKTADKENENNVALSTAYQMLSLCYMQQLSWIDARESIDKAILLTKYDPSVYSFKAIALLGEKSGSKQVIQIKKIMKNLEYALYLEPEDILARDVVSALNQVLKKKTNTSSNIVFNESDKEDLNKLIQHFKFAGID